MIRPAPERRQDVRSELLAGADILLNCRASSKVTPPAHQNSRKTWPTGPEPGGALRVALPTRLETVRWALCRATPRSSRRCLFIDRIDAGHRCYELFPALKAKCRSNTALRRHRSALARDRGHGFRRHLLRHPPHRRRHRQAAHSVTCEPQDVGSPVRSGARGGHDAVHPSLNDRRLRPPVKKPPSSHRNRATRAAMLHDHLVKSHSNVVVRPYAASLRRNPPRILRHLSDQLLVDDR